MRPMWLPALLTLLLTAAAPASAPASLRERYALKLTDVTWHPDQREFRMTIRCDGTARQCSGRLSFALDVAPDDPLGVARSVRLRPRAAQRVTFRQTARAPRLLAHEEERLVEVSLGRLHGENGVTPQPSCASGTTVATDGLARAFRLVGSGLYACTPGGGRPLLLLEENDGLDATTASAVHLAGSYASFALTASFPCGQVVLFIDNLTTRREVRRVSGDALDPVHPDYPCDPSADVERSVLTPAGSLAWISGPHADGTHTVRTVDPLGTIATVDDSSSIASSSLALTVPAGSVTWLRDGALQTAPLP